VRRRKTNHLPISGSRTAYTRWAGWQRMVVGAETDESQWAGNRCWRPGLSRPCWVLGPCQKLRRPKKKVAAHQKIVVALEKSCGIFFTCFDRHSFEAPPLRRCLWSPLHLWHSYFFPKPWPNMEITLMGLLCWPISGLLLCHTASSTQILLDSLSYISISFQ